jgi:hypothetical protein
MEPMTMTKAGESAARQGAVSETQPKLHLAFKMAEVCDLTGLKRETLKYWIIRRWMVPMYPGSAGRNCGHRFSAWQLVGLAILAGALRDLREKNSIPGRSAVIKAMEGLAQQDDALLLSEDQQDMHTAERAAAEIAHCALPAGDTSLSPETYARLAQVVATIDARARKFRRRVARRVAE